jgi:hypothetical protein
MMMPKLKVFVVALAALSASAYAQSANPVQPGTVNYVEGQVTVQGRQLTSSSERDAELRAGQSVSTQDGKAELLLTPGVFLRLGGNTTVELVSPDLMHTEVKLVQGRADVEVDQIYNQNVLLVDMPNGQAQLLKKGLYAFDADKSTSHVFDGEMNVYPGEDLRVNMKAVTVKGGHELAMTGEPAKPQSFNKDGAKDELYNWSSLRSKYLGEANVNLAEEYAGYSSFSPGWYWAGGPYGYTWLPGDGLLWSPFGYGFYSPYYIYGGGYVYGLHGGPALRPYAGGFRGDVRPGFVGGGFHGGGLGGGFNGGGGFHGR